MSRTDYFELRCVDCRTRLKCVLATSREELLVPDYEEAAQSAGESNAESLRSFHAAHGRHRLSTRRVAFIEVRA